MLPVKKIYINSNFKTADSESNSNFKFQLARTFSFPKNSVFYIENFTCSHAWYSVEENFNDAFHVYCDGEYYTTHITPGNYTIQTFIPEFNSQMILNKNNETPIQIVNLSNPPELTNIITFSCKKPFILNMNDSTLAETLGFSTNIRPDYDNIKYKIILSNFLFWITGKYQIISFISVLLI